MVVNHSAASMERLMIIVEIFKGRWQVTNATGTVLVYDLPLGNALEAERYIRAYVSSFNNYNYEVKPLRSPK